MIVIYIDPIFIYALLLHNTYDEILTCDSDQLPSLKSGIKHQRNIKTFDFEERAYLCVCISYTKLLDIFNTIGRN